MGIGSWFLEKHPLWNADHDEHCLTLTCSNDGGAFQLSSARKGNGIVTAEDIDFCIRGFTEKAKGEWTQPASVIFGEFTGSHVSATINDTFWSWWVLGCGPVLLRASYNGPPEYSASELAHVESMLGTLVTA